MKKLFYTLKRIAIIASIFLYTNQVFSQATCAGAQAFCTSTGVNFPASTSTTAPTGPNYGCLGSQPNPAWYYLNIATSGNLTINLTNSANVDIDFIIWGPFATQGQMCTDIFNQTAGSGVDCSFSTAANEQVDIPNAVAGQWYMLLITNFSGQTTNISATAAGGNTGTTNCAILCNMTGLTAVAGACNSTTNTYPLNGVITTTNPPTTGTLTITNSCGGSQTINPPFGTSINYSFPSMPATGGGCSVTATFSSDPTCTLTQAYTAPAPCNPSSCLISNFTANISACQAITSTYTVSGTATFSSPPATGTLTVTVSSGGNTYDTIINPPFVSPLTWSISGIPANGAASTVTIVFSADPTCTSSINFTAPAGCNCPADVGTYTVTTNGTGSGTAYTLCFGNQITLTANGDYTAPGEAFNPPGPAYDPGIAWLLYSCPPTVAVIPDPVNTVPSDPCFLGVVDFNTYTDVNNLAIINSFPPGTFTNNTVYYVPLTMYSISAGTYSYVNTTMPCYEMGTPVAVTYLPQNTVSVAGINPTCNGANDGETIVIPNNGTAPYTYSWTSGCTTASCVGQAPGTYTVTVTDANSCTATASTTITQPVAIVASVTGTTPASCSGVCDGTATANGSGGAGGITYSWNTIPVQNTATATGLCVGTYTCTIRDQNNCTTTVTATITEPTPIVLSPIAGAVICNGSSTNLTASASGGSGVYNYTWSPATGLSATNIANPVASPLTTTVYTVNATDANGCTATPIQVTVMVHPPLNLVIGGTNSICPGASTPLSSVVTDGNGGPYTYLWSPATGLSDPFVANPIASPSATTTYTLTVNDGCSPSVTATVTVTVQSLPQVNLTSDVSSGCAPVCVFFTDASSVSSGTISSWNWNFGDNTTSTSQNPSHCYYYPGQYSVSLTVTSSTGCTNDTTINQMINVYAIPNVQIVSTPNPATVLEPTVYFDNISSSDVNQWSWNLAHDGATSSSPTTSYTYPQETQSYNVTLTVTTVNGCVNSTEQLILIAPEFTFFIPNAFSPNGDGRNDTFFGEGIGIVDYDIWIYDRWGNLIFHGEHLSDAWDGRANNGSDIAQQDVYVWKVKLKDVFGKKHNYIGSVTIVK